MKIIFDRSPSKLADVFVCPFADNIPSFIAIRCKMAALAAILFAKCRMLTSHLFRDRCIRFSFRVRVRVRARLGLVLGLGLG